MTITSGGAPLSIVDGVRGFAAASPTAPAVVDGDRVQTYAELDERSSRLAQALLSSGTARGERVAVLLGNRLEYCEVAAGIAKAGLVMVPLNPRMTAPEVEYVVAHSGARTLLLDDALASIAAGPAGELDRVLSLDGEQLGPSYDAALAAAGSRDPRVVVAETDPFCVAYTSGTTGKPKGVVISHRSRSLTFVASALEWGLGTGRRSIAVAPMYHGAGFAFGYAPVYTGGTVAMLRAWDPEALLAMIERERAQSVFLVPTHAQMLRSLGEEAIAKADLSSLDTLYFNAAALPTTLKEWVLATFPHVGVHELYGSTEGGIITNLRPADARRKSGSVGHAWHFTELRVVDDAGQPVTPGEPGELYSRSPYLMNGYLDDPAATAECTTDDGFLTSGDVVTVDEEGYIRIVDRKKDLIISGGVNVYPRDVEEAVLTHPAVREVAVVGAPHETWGEQVVAYVVTVPGADLDQPALDAHLRPLLSAYKIPRAVTVVEALPRNAAGKILKRDLRADPTS
ncbi:MAG TPA: AMP-binding protein [Candidatus Nanopelagicales bacterium]|nr:AMP-binding protein [Candidatus Nanopelagicales bacterium]